MAQALPIEILLGIYLGILSGIFPALVASGPRVIVALVVAIRTETGDIEAIPSRTRPLSVGETVYAIARPAQLRQLESAAGAVVR